jgi:uncharacterized oxidoreductase
MGALTQTEAARVTVAPEELERYAAALISGLGGSHTHADRVAASLVSSNLAGHDSHGVLLIPYYAELVSRGQIRLDSATTTIIDRGGVTVLDGNFGWGQVAGMDATEHAASRARELGLACVLARNVNHLGRLGEYTSALAEQGFVALLLVNCQGSGQLLPPFGGIDRRLTNNPVSVAAPGDTDPVLLDIALSVVAEAKVWLAKARGEPVPEGCVLDADGQPSTEPDALFDGGVLLPVGGTGGGHKAYGLIVLVDIIAGMLSGGGVCRADAPEDFSNALFLLAVDVEPLVARSVYDSELATLRDHIKSSRRAPGVDEILLPGEFEARTRAQRADAIEIETTTWQELGVLAQRLDVTPPELKS